MRLIRGGAFRAVNRVVPGSRGYRRIDHGGIVRWIDGAKPGRDRAFALVAVYAQLQEFDGQGIARFSSLM